MVGISSRRGNGVANRKRSGLQPSKLILCMFLAGSLMFVFNVYLQTLSTTPTGKVVPLSQSMDHFPVQTMSKRVDGFPDRPEIDRRIKQEGGEMESSRGPQQLKVAWLMSFPNSGTSYTLDAVRGASGTAIATNYGTEIDTWDADGDSMAVFDNNGNGPFWVAPQPVDLPTKLVLTKTHCGGHCVLCKFFRSVQNLHSFMVRCRSGVRRHVDGSGVHDQVVTYDENMIAKAIHLIRSPFSNSVSRFHHYKYTMKLDVEIPNTREGFRRYCANLDRMYASQGDVTPYVDPKVMDILKHVPCQTEFIRYAHWHDMAFLTTDELNIPTKVLYYEEYSTSFNTTVTELLDFLQLEKIAQIPEFIEGKVYSDYFTKEERELVKVAMKGLSSRKTWQHIRHYFEENVVAHSTLF